MKFFSLVLPSDPNVALTFIQFVVNIYGVVKKNSARKPQHMCLMIRNFDLTNGINIIRIKMAKHIQSLHTTYFLLKDNVNGELFENNKLFF